MMLEKLLSIESIIPAMITAELDGCWRFIEDNMWKTVDISYHPPKVERIWFNIGDLTSDEYLTRPEWKRDVHLDIFSERWQEYKDCRLSLHVIHPCDEGMSLVHPHPWKGAFHVLSSPDSGIYEQGVVVYGNEVMKMQVFGDAVYEMCDRTGHHYVRPIGGPVYTIMLSGPIEWKENLDPNRSKYNLQPLSHERKKEIMKHFRALLTMKTLQGDLIITKRKTLNI